MPASLIKSHCFDPIPNSLAPKFQNQKPSFFCARAGLCGLAIRESRKRLIYQIHLIEIGPNAHLYLLCRSPLLLQPATLVRDFVLGFLVWNIKMSCKMGCCWPFDARLGVQPASTTRLFVVLGKWSRSWTTADVHISRCLTCSLHFCWDGGKVLGREVGLRYHRIS